jgi:phosphonate transport system substrate-binding protein
VKRALCAVIAAGCLSQPESYVPAPKPSPPRAAPAPLPDDVKTVRLGLPPLFSESTMRNSRAPLVRYLSAELHVPIELVVGSDYDDVGERMAKGEIDVGEFSPFAYVRARKKAHLRPIVSAIHSGSSTAAGYIIVREDSPMHDLADLKGARFGFVDPASTSGYLFPLKIFKERGIDPGTYFAGTRFLGSHDAVLLALLDGGIEAGAAWQGAFAALKNEQGIDPLSFRVIAKLPRTPQDVLCVREDLPAAVVSAVRGLLMRLSMHDRDDREILAPMGVNGFVDVDPAAYDAVERIAFDLDAGAPPR